jgi:serine/threonine protein kinase
VKNGAPKDDTLSPEYLAPGTVLAGQYRLLEIVGEGGMGVIYRATQESVGRNVAVKVLRPRFAQNDVIVRRFENEARIISQLRHPNTIRLYDCQRMKNGSLFIVTEFLHGQSLFRLLRNGPLEIDRAVRIIDQICGSLSEAHAAGVIHRDLKPENIFLDHVGKEDHVRVLDFGIAKLAEDESFHTQPDILIGTPSYMAPEQASGDGADARSDIYAIGILLFQMISGRVPFTADTPVGILVKQIKEIPPRLATCAPNAGVTRELDDFVARLLSKAPADRPPTIDEVRDQLREIAFRRLWTTPSASVPAWRTPPPELIPMEPPILTIPPPADPRAVHALATHPEILNATMPGRPIRLSEPIEMTPPADLELLDLPVTMRHPWIKWLGALGTLAAGTAVAAWFLLLPAKNADLRGIKTSAPSTPPVRTASVSVRAEPKPTPDPRIAPAIAEPVVEKTHAATAASAPTRGTDVEAEADEAGDLDALDRAIEQDLKPAPAARKTAPHAKPMVPTPRPPPHLEQRSEKLTTPDDGPIPVEIE